MVSFHHSDDTVAIRRLSRQKRGAGGGSAWELIKTGERTWKEGPKKKVAPKGRGAGKNFLAGILKLFAKGEGGFL